jgi:hypothetical protein
LIPCQSASSNGRADLQEAIRVSGLPIVVAKRLLIQIPKQVKWLDAHVGTVQSTLQERPEIFKAVGVYLSVNVCNGVVNHFVLKVIKSFV